jgi:hypothetical protein
MTEIDREQWPESLPTHVRQGASARDALLWYITDGWGKIFGGDVVTVFDHDFGHHVLRNGSWQLTLTNLDEFPDDEFSRTPNAGPARCTCGAEGTSARHERACPARES